MTSRVHMACEQQEGGGGVVQVVNPQAGTGGRETDWEGLALKEQERKGQRRGTLLLPTTGGPLLCGQGEAERSLGFTSVADLASGSGEVPVTVLEPGWVDPAVRTWPFNL